jgi:hypothetical protein
MIIYNLKFAKMDKTDPRYPSADAWKRSDGSIIDFTDVYLCECETDDGPREKSYFVTHDMTPKDMESVLTAFAVAIGRMDKPESSKAA